MPATSSPAPAGLVHLVDHTPIRRVRDGRRRRIWRACGFGVACAGMVSGLEQLGITDDADEQVTKLIGDDGAEARRAAPKTRDKAPASEDDPAGDDEAEASSIMLEQISLFAGLLPVHLERMGRLAQIIEYRKNDYVFKHGEESDGLYLVLEGAVRISRNVSGMGEEALAILREGQHFGEMSLIDDDVPRSADAICHERARLLKLPKDDLRDLMFVDRELAYELLWRFVRTLSGRLRDSNDRLMMLTMSSKF